MIGILTYYHISNYGANFQAFALQHSILEMGREVVMIKYQSNAITKRAIKRFFLKMKKGKHILLKFLFILNNIMSHFCFKCFRKNICVLKD